MNLESHLIENGLQYDSRVVIYDHRSYVKVIIPSTFVLPILLNTFPRSHLYQKLTSNIGNQSFKCLQLLPFGKQNKLR